MSTTAVSTVAEAIADVEADAFWRIAFPPDLAQAGKAEADARTQCKRFANRETWLREAIGALRGIIFAGKHDAACWPKLVRVACGWPKGTHGKSRAIGQCWSTLCSKDGAVEMFISPELSEPTRVLDVLAHELVHAVVGVKHGHKKPFADMAKAIGLTGKMTATVASPELELKLCVLASMLGTYPHAELASSDPLKKKQTTRMLKVECQGCGCIVRMTRQWIDDVGTPTCRCGCPMAEDVQGGEE